MVKRIAASFSSLAMRSRDTILSDLRERNLERYTLDRLVEAKLAGKTTKRGYVAGHTGVTAAAFTRIARMYVKRMEKDLEMINGKLLMPFLQYNPYPLRLIVSTRLPQDTASRIVMRLIDWMNKHDLPIHVGTNQRTFTAPSDYMSSKEPDKLVYTTIEFSPNKTTNNALHSYRFFAFLNESIKVLHSFSRYACFNNETAAQLIQPNPRLIKKKAKELAEAERRKTELAARRAKALAAEDDRNATASYTTASTRGPRMSGVSTAAATGTSPTVPSSTRPTGTVI